MPSKFKIKNRKWQIISGINKYTFMHETFDLINSKKKIWESSCTWNWNRECVVVPTSFE